MDGWAWPLSIVGFLLIFVLVFRPHIGRFFDRMSGIKLPGGIHAEAPNPQSATQPPALAPPVTDLASQEQLGSPPVSDLYAPFEADMRQRIANSVPDHKFHYDWAIRINATAAVRLVHEANYRNILGSQIRAMKFMAQNSGRASESALREVFDQAKTADPEAFRSFEFAAWLSYLLRAEYFVTVEMPGQPSFELSLLGRDFLVWLVYAGVSEDKAY